MGELSKVMTLGKIEDNCKAVRNGCNLVPTQGKKLSDDEIDALRTLYDAFDLNGDGCLGSHELQSCVKGILNREHSQYQITEEDILAMVEMVHPGTPATDIPFETFRRLLTYSPEILAVSRQAKDKSEVFPH